MIPNYAMIGEISLFSFGFGNAKILAEKMVATFKLSSEQLSSQDHYDFGMRAVKTVISSAGNLKRERPNDNEDLILLRALRDVNLPKFLADDVPLFNGIISDLFPGIVQPSIDYGNLHVALNKATDFLGLQPQENFIKKCIQLYETTVVRHGLMLVGPSGGAKTSCTRSLAHAITSLAGTKAPNGSIFQKVKIEVLNPKSITMGQLYGEFDLQTHEWSDGIFSFLMREGAESTTLDKKWYVFDGPVDAVWVESMNTLLDDNKKLCLSSGEIIKMNSSQTIMFEVSDLAFASPATVSRCGMIYMEPGSLGLAPYIHSWMCKQKAVMGLVYFKAFEPAAKALFDLFIEPAIHFWKTTIKESVPTSSGSLLSSLMNIFGSLINPLVKIPLVGLSVFEPVDITPLVEPSFIFSLIWSIGATGDGEGRSRFDAWLRTFLKDHPPAIKIPRNGSVYDYTFQRNEMQWTNWNGFLVDSETPKTLSIVPTSDTLRNTFLIDLLMMNGHHVLVTGTTGTGKSVTIQEKLLRGLPEEWVPIMMNFSARTGANQTQDFIDGKLEKKRKGVYGPPSGKKFILFIDDLNMPQLDICNAQPPIELIRQWMDYGGWYERKQVGKFMEVQDLSFICAMGPPGGGRNPVTTRLSRHFNLLNFVDMEDISLQRIFTTILGGFLDRFPAEIAARTDSLVDASISIYNTIRNEMLPTPAKSHYTFNLRDMAKVVQGLLNADSKTVTTALDIVRLWVHETMRVFQDRLVDNLDKSWFKDLVSNTMKDKLHLGWEDVVTKEPLLFGDYLVPGGDPKIYTEVKVRNVLKAGYKEAR